MLFSSHELETVERVSSRVVILHRGRVVADDSIARLRTLMALPTLEDIFAQLAVEQDTAACRVRSPTSSGLTAMTKRQFRVLYRDFLFRIVDRELLSTHAKGDASQLLLQIVALLIFLSVCFCVPAFSIARQCDRRWCD